MARTGLDFAYNEPGTASIERERTSARGTPMRHAIIVASSYHESAQLAALPTAPETAAAIAARLGAPDSAFTVHALTADRDLPERVDELLWSLDPSPEVMLLYFCGYAAWIGNHAPALVLNAPRLRAYSLGRLCSALERRAPRTLLILDVRVVVAAGRTPGEAAEAICDVIDEAPTVEAIVAAHQAGTSPDVSSPFTRLFLGSWEWLAAVRGSTAATSRDLHQLVQVGERLVDGLVATRFSPGSAEVVLLPPLAGTPPPPRPASEPELEPVDSLPPPRVTAAHPIGAEAAPAEGVEVGAEATIDAAPVVVPAVAPRDATDEAWDDVSARAPVPATSAGDAGPAPHSAALDAAPAPTDDTSPVSAEEARALLAEPPDPGGDLALDATVPDPAELVMQTVTEADIVPLPADEPPRPAMSAAAAPRSLLDEAGRPPGAATEAAAAMTSPVEPTASAPARRVTLLDEDFEATLRAEAPALLAQAPGVVAALPPLVAERIASAAAPEPSATTRGPAHERPPRRVNLAAAPPPPLERATPASGDTATPAMPDEGSWDAVPPTAPSPGAAASPEGDDAAATTAHAHAASATPDDEAPPDPDSFDLEPTPPPAAPVAVAGPSDPTAAAITPEAPTPAAAAPAPDEQGATAAAPAPEPEPPTAVESSPVAAEPRAPLPSDEPSIVVGDDLPPAPSRAPPPPTLTLEEHLTRAEQLTADNRYDEALLEVSRALKLAGDDQDQVADLHARAAGIARLRGDVGRAVAHYEEVLSRRPVDPEALFWATELLCARGEFSRAARLHELRLAALTAPEERDAVLETLATLWIDQAHDLPRGRAVLEGLLRSRGDEPALLERLIGVLDGLGDHEESIRVRRRLAYKLADDPRRRAAVLIGAARVAHDRLQKVEFAVDLAEQALRADPAAIEALDFVAALLIERRDWPLLARCFEAVLDKLPDGVPARDLARRLGAVCRDELKDPRRAARALERAAAIDPTDATIRRELVPLLEQCQDSARALHHCRAAIRSTPRDPRAHQLARTLALRLGAHDQAWNAAHALDFLGEADVDASVHADTHRPEGLLPVTAAITEEQWQRGVFTPDRDAALEALWALVRPAAIAHRLEVLTRARQLPTLDPSLRLDPQTSTTMLARSFLWTVQVLGIPQPALYVHPSLEVGLIAPPALEPASVVNRALGSGLDLRELSFLWGRHLTIFRPDFRLLTFFPTVDLLAHLTAAAALAAEWTDRKASFVEPATAELARRIHEDLGEDGRGDLVAASAEVQRGDVAARLLDWARGVELTAARVGLVACGDVSVAAALTERFPVGGHTSVFDQVNALLGFTADDEYAALREHLGVTVRA